MSKIKRILVKSLLCLSLVLGATLFISFDADASCWTKTKEGWGTCACDGTGSEWACWSIEGECTFWCDGHEHTDIHDESYNEFGENIFGKYYIHHVHLWSPCNLCHRIIHHYADEPAVYYHNHNWKTPDQLGHTPFYRSSGDLCQVWYNNYIMCPDCGAIIDTDDAFIGWSHIKDRVSFKKTSVNGDKDYHALYCSIHKWVNADNCEDPPSYLGTYVGEWAGLQTPYKDNDNKPKNGLLKYYKHNWKTTDVTDGREWHCTLCSAIVKLECCLTSSRSDNNKVIAKSNVQKEYKPEANIGWTNCDVNLTAGTDNKIYDKQSNTLAGTTVSKEGTSVYYTKVSSNGCSLTSKDHYVKIDKTAPKLTGTSVKAGTYQAPVTTSTAHDSESYGLKVTLKADDSNANARGGANDVAKIKEAYVIVRDKDNANNSKRYNIDGVTDKVSINTSKVIDVNKDFHGVLDFVYEIHVIDYAGNDAVKTDTIIRNPEVFLSVKNVTQNIQLNGSNVFLGGEHGILTITTTGYCDISNLKWNNYTLKASEKDQEKSYSTIY